MSTAWEVGIKEGRAACEAGQPNSPDRTAFFNDAGAAMEYRDAFRKGWHDRYNEKLVASLRAYKVGSTIRVLVGGNPTMVEVTSILPDLDPPRLEGNRVQADHDIPMPEGMVFEELDQTDRVWAFESDIIEVIKL